jgi:hypothetical protein
MCRIVWPARLSRQAASQFPVQRHCGRAVGMEGGKVAVGRGPGALNRHPGGAKHAFYHERSASLTSCRSASRIIRSPLITAARFEFDTRRFESSQLSQPPRSLPGHFLNFAKSRHFRRLAAKSLVSGKEFCASRTEGHESGGKSLFDKLHSRFRPSVLGDDAASKIAALPERGHLMAEIASGAGFDGMALAAQLHRTACVGFTHVGKDAFCAR